ncbi:unnamed protein product [Ectocarpus sp. 4 AP-2014]
MPAGDGLGDDASRGSPTSAADQYSSSASVMVSQRPPPVFSAQQTPHRVQSSTNLDLVDCVGSDLLLAMNNLDVNEQQARACANLANNGCHHGLHEGGPGAGSPPPAHPPPPGDGGFLPLAALAPPPARQPSWLTAQQQQARVQNEHFPSSSRGSSYGCDSGEEGGGAGGGGTHHRQLRSSSCGGVVMGGGRLDDDDSSRQQQAYPPGSSGNSNSRGSPGALPPPGFGLDSCSSVGSWNGSTNSSTNNSAAAAAAAARLRRPCSSSSNGGNPHLDESWTAVLNAPAGAELMEFLTERPSRALVLWNVEAIGEDELRAACEGHGPLYYLRAEHRRKRVIFVAYYDVRDAVNAHRSLGSELSKYLLDEHGARPRPAVHFSVELHAGFSYKEGSVVAHDLPAQVTEAEVGSVFQVYGDLRRVAQHHAYPSSFSVEFCSIQDARVAAQELTVRNPWGHGITVEPAVRSEAERALGKKLHATLNRWTAESAQVHEDRMRSSSSSIVMSGRSSDSDSPPPKPERDYGRGMGFMMDLYTPVTSMNTTPNTTPGSTPPSGADAHQNGGSKSPGVHHYMTMPLRQQHAHGRGTGGSSSAPPHPMYTSSSNGSNKNSMQQQQQQFGGSNGGSGGHHHLHHLHRNGYHAHMDNGKPHPLASPLGGPASYAPPSSSSSPGCNGYFVDVSPGYHGDHDDTRTPPAPMWAAAASVSPPRGHVGSGGMRGSPPLRGMPGGCAGAGGLGYKDVRTRQMSLDDARLQHENIGGAGSGGARAGRCNSDSSSQILMAASSPHSAGPECSGNGGHEFSLDLKKVSKGMDKRTTIMVRNIPNKYTQTMLLQEIDSSYRGAYDFFYLPIDFKNKCNVGYAFINFMDYRRIVPFFREFNAQRWKNFNSEKVCAISYARIQGKASMISRFQNSSLMEKDGEYRPLIFHSMGPERGRPEPFPASSKAYRAVLAPGGGGGGVFGVRDRERSVSNSSTLSMS